MHPLGDTLNTPAFLGKLWKMVNDPSTDHLICWSPAGNSFLIQNQAQFMYELLPLYYKHNNMSSFVRQLNMYGFHKLSTVDNGTMDADRDEIQFSHPFFIRNQPQLLRNIKRKTTSSKVISDNVSKHDELNRILSDVKHLRGRQANVDNQLLAMKQENALLWREVAILRQKHIKQQKIVNKLIQFLVTLVQPSRMTVGGLKRGYQLMLNESPNKKAKRDHKKSDSMEGPTIHELDNELDLAPDDMYEEEQLVVESASENENDVVTSPTTPTGSQNDMTSPIDPDLLVNSVDDFDKPEYVSIDVACPSEDVILPGSSLNEASLISTLETAQKKVEEGSVNDKVFLNPSTQDTLLSNLINGANYTENSSETNSTQEEESSQKNELALDVASKNRHLIKNFPNGNELGVDLTSHVENTQNELDQFKDILNSYSTYVDANALIGEMNKIPRNDNSFYLFNEDSPAEFHLPAPEEPVENTSKEKGDPLVSGGEVAPYTGGFDFDELFDESLDTLAVEERKPVVTSGLSTPQTIQDAPIFAIQNKQ